MSMTDDETARRTDAPLSSLSSEYCPGPHSVRRLLAVYCRNCDVALCETCFIQAHNGHHHSNVDEVAVELRDQLRRDADGLANVAVQHAERLNELQV